MDTNVQAVVPIAFGKRVLNADSFMTLFQAGMSLVEDAACYLDGEGRKESRDLGRLEGLSYSTNSMVLTTRLMQMASWLLLHRALREGELTEESAKKQALDSKLSTWKAHTEVPAGLPTKLVEMIGEADSLARRITALHVSLYGQIEGSPEAESDPLEGIRKIYDEA